jgi:hypothetical protein
MRTRHDDDLEAREVDTMRSERNEARLNNAQLWVGGLAAAALVGLFSWFGMTTFDVATNIAVVSGTLVEIRRGFDGLDERVTTMERTRYSQSDAQRDREVISDKLDLMNSSMADIREWSRRMDGYMRALEKDSAAKGPR